MCRLPFCSLEMTDTEKLTLKTVGCFQIAFHSFVISTMTDLHPSSHSPLLLCFTMHLLTKLRTA